jgi:LCP family protein required for cell wall assembly
MVMLINHSNETSMDFKAKKIKQESETMLKMKATMKTVKEKIPHITFPRQFIKYIVLAIGISFILYISFAGYSFIKNLQFDFSIPNIINNLFGQDLKTDSFGKTNILLLGVGGGNHDGPDLTDSILVASYDHAKKTVTMISIPRDLYVKIVPGYYERINVTYDYFNRKMGKEAAVKGTEDMIKQITGLDMQYYAKVNFNGFREVVDILGGIDVQVPETLIDPEYPVEDANGTFLRNERFEVQKGLQHMDGETALRYARSRHSTSDFDRALRQQLVIAAIREKALKENYLSNPTALKRLFYAVSANLETDININEMIRGAMLAKDLPKDRMISVGLNDDNTKAGGFLYTPDRALTGGASVLLPDGASMNNFDYYTDIRRFVDIAVNNQEIFFQKAKIRILNGTKVSGLGKTLQDKLSRYGFNVAEVANPKNKVQVTKTAIYVLQPDRFKETVDALQTFILGDVIPQQLFEQDTAIQETVPDIEIVIGQDYARYLP